MELDPPAAHSMDTTWFAVDADGRVARFDSGEAGAVPNGAAIGFSELPSSFDQTHLVRWLLARAWLRELDADRARVENDEQPEVSQAVLVAVTTEGSYRESDPRVEDLLADAEPVVLRDGAIRVIATNRALPQEVVETLRTHPHVLRLEYQSALDDDEEHRARELFLYENRDYEVPGAYLRAGEPDDPVVVDELPRELRAPIERLRFPVRFTEVGALQLADHMRDADASIWGDVTLVGQPLGGPGPRGAHGAPTGRLLVIVVAVLALIVFTIWLRTR